MLEFWYLWLLQGIWEVGDGRDVERKASRFQQSNSRSYRWDWKFCGVPLMESCSWLNFVDSGTCDGVRRLTLVGSGGGGSAASARPLFIKIGSADDIVGCVLELCSLLQFRSLWASLEGSPVSSEGVRWVGTAQIRRARQGLRAGRIIGQFGKLVILGWRDW